MSDTTFLKLMKGSRLNNYLGLEMDPGSELSNGKNYLYIELPVRGATSEEGTVLEVKRNQHVFLEAAAQISVKGNNVFEVEANPALSEFGQVQGIQRLHPDSGKQRAGVWFTARKDLNLGDLGYLVRIYMVA